LLLGDVGGLAYGHRGSQLGHSFESLPPKKRAQRYREFANDAIRKAVTSGKKPVRAAYLSLAAGWHTLAIEAERAIEGERGIGPREDVPESRRFSH
jgi:hypothetical protein